MIPKIAEALALALEVRRFVQSVERELKGECGHVVILYQHSSNYGKGFPRMRDKKFREACLYRLSGHPLLEPGKTEFSPPDSYDDWTFYAYRRRK